MYLSHNSAERVQNKSVSDQRSHAIPYW